jgi:hypothetical protein
VSGERNELTTMAMTLTTDHPHHQGSELLQLLIENVSIHD